MFCSCFARLRIHVKTLNSIQNKNNYILTTLTVHVLQEVETTVLSQEVLQRMLPTKSFYAVQLFTFTLDDILDSGIMQVLFILTLFIPPSARLFAHLPWFIGARRLLIVVSASSKWMTACKIRYDSSRWIGSSPVVPSPKVPAFSEFQIFMNIYLLLNTYQFCSTNFWFATWV